MLYGNGHGDGDINSPGKLLQRYPTTEKSDCMDNLFANLPIDLSTEVTESLLNSPVVRIERIVSQGQSSADGDWYDQEENEWVVVLQGKAQLRFEDDNQLLDLEPGDYLNIPAHRRHRVEWTASDQPTVWLAVFHPSAEAVCQD